MAQELNTYMPSIVRLNNKEDTILSLMALFITASGQQNSCFSHCSVPWTQEAEGNNGLFLLLLIINGNEPFTSILPVPLIS